MNTFFLLVADDDKDDCFLFEEALKQLPVSTRLSFVHDGNELLQHLLVFKPLADIIFLDLNMPRKNGFTSLVEIKNNEKLRHIPVVVFSTSADRYIIDRLYQHGADFYITKPNNFDELKNLIHLAIDKVAEVSTPKPSVVEFVLSAHGAGDKHNRVR